MSSLGASTPLDRPRPASAGDRSLIVSRLIVSRRAVLWLVVVSAAAIGWTATRGGSSARADIGAELEHLLRAMVVIKALLAVGAIGLIDWRLRSPATPWVAVAYGAAATLIAGAPAVMWHLTHLVAGALLFHAGVGLLLVIAWRDDGRPPLRPIR